MQWKHKLTPNLVALAPIVPETRLYRLNCYCWLRIYIVCTACHASCCPLHAISLGTKFTHWNFNCLQVLKFQVTLNPLSDCILSASPSPSPNHPCSPCLTRWTECQVSVSLSAGVIEVHLRWYQQCLSSQQQQQQQQSHIIIAFEVPIVINIIIIAIIIIVFIIISFPISIVISICLLRVTTRC